MAELSPCRDGDDERGEAAHAPLVLVVTGVSGVGKSSIGRPLAQRLGWEFVDGDDFHSADAIARMRGGQPLTDDDRRPWLARIADWIDAQLGAGRSAIVACSALKREYRARLVRGRAAIRVVFLDGDRELIARRLEVRREHFMPASLLESQFAALEPPEPDENVIIVDAADAPNAVVDVIAAALDHDEF